MRRSKRNRRRRTARETKRRHFLPRYSECGHEMLSCANGPLTGSILPLLPLIKIQPLDYSTLGNVAQKLPLENTRLENTRIDDAMLRSVDLRALPLEHSMTTTLPERIGGE